MLWIPQAFVSSEENLPCLHWLLYSNSLPEQIDELQIRKRSIFKETQIYLSAHLLLNSAKIPSCGILVMVFIKDE